MADSIPLPKPGDILFQESPSEGDPDCICSACGLPIGENCVALRLFVDEGRGGEYRYHDICAGIFTNPEPFAGRDPDPWDAVDWNEE